MAMATILIDATTIHYLFSSNFENLSRVYGMHLSDALRVFLNKFQINMSRSSKNGRQPWKLGMIEFIVFVGLPTTVSMCRSREFFEWQFGSKRDIGLI